MTEPRNIFSRVLGPIFGRVLGPSGPAPEVQVTVADRGTAALVIAVFVTMTAFVSLTAYIGFRFLSPRLAGPAGAGAAVARGGGSTREAACREDLAGQCPEGQLCVEGACVPDAAAAACEDGAPCNTCTCIYPMTCGDDAICHAGPVKAAKCTPRAAEFVREMLAYQVQCIAHAGGVELTNCPATNVRDFLLSHEKFDALLQEFHPSGVFLFPEGRPDIASLGLQYEGPSWPDEPTRAHYRAALSKQAPALVAAKHVVIVARASKGNTAMSFAYAQARLRFARSVLLDVIAASPGDRSGVAGRFIEFAIGAERPLNLEFFLLNQQPALLWNDRAAREFSQMLEGVRNNQPLTRDRRQAAEDLINRSVAIFAVPPECMGVSP